MRIAVWHNLPSGGGKRALYYHVRGLVERGHHVEAWCPPTADLSYLPLSGMVREHVVALPVATRKSRLPGFRFVGHYAALLEPLVAMEAHCRAVAVEVKKKGFDVLFANSSHYPLAVAPIGRVVELPKLLYLQEPSRSLYEARPQLPWLPPDYVKGIWPTWPFKRALGDYARTQVLRLSVREEGRNLEAYDRVLVNSYFSRESVARAFGSRPRVCYLGVDTALFRDQHLTREDFVLGLGRLENHKNPDLVIEAVSRIPHPRPAVQWVADAEGGNYRGELEHKARLMGVDLRIHLRVEDLQLVELLNRGFVLVYTPILEPFGFAPLEANACATPVIGVSEGGVRETVRDGVNGLLVEPEAAELANAIQRLRREPDLARKLGTQGRSLVEELWSVEASVDRLEKHLSIVARGLSQASL